MLPSDAPFLATVKTSPEEWRQVLWTMNATQRSQLAPVQCLVSILNRVLVDGPDYLYSYLYLRYKYTPSPTRFRSTSNCGARRVR